MTLANQITLARILAIPVFVTLAVYYGLGVQQGIPQEGLRVAAIVVFMVAAISDGLDGYIARHYNQRTRLGQVLDPIADKGLLLAGIITLTFSDWHYAFPLWFPILVISRDGLVVAGALLLHVLNGKIHIRPRWTGKIATVLQMAAVCAAMLLNPPDAPLSDSPFPWIQNLNSLPAKVFGVEDGFSIDYLVLTAGFFTFLSGIGYVVDGIRQLQAGDHATA